MRQKPSIDSLPLEFHGQVGIRTSTYLGGTRKTSGLCTHGIRHCHSITWIPEQKLPRQLRTIPSAISTERQCHCVPSYSLKFKYRCCILSVYIVQGKPTESTTIRKVLSNYCNAQTRCYNTCFEIKMCLSSIVDIRDGVWLLSALSTLHRRDHK